jgi:hypothetical protein
MCIPKNSTPMQIIDDCPSKAVPLLSRLRSAQFGEVTRQTDAGGGDSELDHLEGQADRGLIADNRRYEWRPPRCPASWRHRETPMIPNR